MKKNNIEVKKKTRLHADSRMKTEWVSEGAAELIVPKGSSTDPFHKLAFYNPVMAFNRTLSARVVQAVFAGESVAAVDGLCATGARGIRYLLESSVCKHMTFIDANEHAISLLEKNIRRNRLSSRSTVVCREYNEGIYALSSSPQLVEIDPFGSPVPFLSASVQRIAHDGLLSATATDFAKLAGANAGACKRQYDAVPLHEGAGHEIGLRIVLGKMARMAAEHERGILPLFCFYQGHAGKVMARVRAPGARHTDESLEQVGYAWVCHSCMARGVMKEKCGDACIECGAMVRVAGPLWIGRLCDQSILEKALNVNAIHPQGEWRQRSASMLSLLAQENAMPAPFYPLHEVVGKWKRGIPSFDALFRRIEERGYACSRTHFSPTGLRTNAPARVLRECLGT